MGIMIGCGMGSIDDIDQASRQRHERGPRRLSPHLISRFRPHMAASQVARQLGWHGAAALSCPSTACAAGAQPLEKPIGRSNMAIWMWYYVEELKHVRNIHWPLLDFNNVEPYPVLINVDPFIKIAMDFG